MLGSFKGFTLQENKGNRVPLGFNTRAVDCTDYHGNLEMFVLDLSRAIESGIGCLAKQGETGKRDAARLLALFDERIKQRPVTIFCAKPGSRVGTGFTKQVLREEVAGLAFDTDFPDFPGFVINTDSSITKSGYQERRSLLLHEMLHWLDYRHSETFDMPYIATACCFNKNPEKACSLLKDAPHFDSEEYLERFAEVSVQSSVAIEVPIRAGIAAAKRKKSGTPIMATIKPLFSSEFQPFLGYMLARTSYWATEPEKRELVDNMRIKQGLYQDKHRRFADLMGQLAGRSILSDNEGTHYLWSLIRTEADNSTCNSLSSEERDDLASFIRATTLDILQAETIPVNDLSSWTNLCGLNLFN